MNELGEAAVFQSDDEAVTLQERYRRFREADEAEAARRGLPPEPWDAD